MSSAPQNNSRVLQHALLIMRPLVAWLLRSGVSYGAFAAAAKLIFVEQARDELVRHGHKCTDSSLSVLSGLQRKNVSELLPAIDALDAQARSLGRPSLASQVITRWLALREEEKTPWPAELPLTGENISFESLVRAISRNVHWRAVATELSRLGVVTLHEEAGQIPRMVLRLQSFTPSSDLVESMEFLAGAVGDHFWTGVNNITLPEHSQLDQSVMATGLHPASVRELQVYADTLWAEVFKKVVDKATVLTDADEPNGGKLRMRLGMYFYGEQPPKPSPKSKKRTKP